MPHDIYMGVPRPVIIMCCKFHTSATVGPTHDPLAHDIYDVFLRPLMIKHCKMHGSVVVVAPVMPSMAAHDVAHDIYSVFFFAHDRAL